ncbi:hypothetical protein AHOG_17170 [Actinoalloteichus hoggarensis]|uniref:Uncharacterized protein n=1 Tax=Actinoalloteichus hoggarensis TaxID=1470176 RepID=A0A221W621_9PSEU|nr:hypothetical protein AHOG_17170 [Actinoalloteichus hoggarensis]
MAEDPDRTDSVHGHLIDEVMRRMEEMRKRDKR